MHSTLRWKKIPNFTKNFFKRTKKMYFEIQLLKRTTQIVNVTRAPEPTH